MLARASALAQLRWIADKVQVTWDRYVLTFGAQDQLDLITGAVAGTLRVAHSVRPAQLAAAGASLAGFGLLVWLLAGSRHRLGWAGQDAAARAIDRMRARLVRLGVDVPPSATPRGIAAMVASGWPAVEGPITDLASLAEVELYSARALRARERVRARELSRTVRRSWGRDVEPGEARPE